MIPRANIAVLDDNEDHLRKLIDCLNGMGHSALPILFREGRAQINAALRTVQLVFIDIHLVPAVPPGPAAYDIVAQALETIVDPDCGPYILISWSTHPDHHDALMSHLAENLRSETPPPAASAALDKNRYLGGAIDLSDGIIQAVETVPQVNALISWNNTAQIAAGEVINSLLGLTDRSQRFSGTNGEALERLLAAIAKEGGGEHAEGDRTAALNEGLGPILLDRLMHGTAANRDKMEAAWSAAIPNINARNAPTEAECALLNTMTAISIHDIQNVSPGSRGAVCDLPEHLRTDGGFRTAFGCLPAEALETFVSLKREDNRVSGKLSKVDKANLRQQLVGRYRLVGLSAACDHAWGKVPVLKMLLAVEFPSSYAGDFELAGHDARYQTPFFNFPNTEDSGYLVFNWRYYWSLPNTDIGVRVQYRLREPLMSHLTTHYHVHGFRPGIPDFKMA